MGAVFDKESTRVAFGNALIRMADEDPTIMYVAADTLKSVGGAPMHKKYPERAINVGIAEQNMALVGAGMAARSEPSSANRIWMSRLLRGLAHCPAGRRALPIRESRMWAFFAQSRIW